MGLSATVILTTKYCIYNFKKKHYIRIQMTRNQTLTAMCSGVFPVCAVLTDTTVNAVLTTPAPMVA